MHKSRDRLLTTFIWIGFLTFAVVVAASLITAVNVVTIAHAQQRQAIIEQQSARQIIASNLLNLTEHRLASRCFEHSMSSILESEAQLLARVAHEPLPAAVRRAVRSVPLANIDGIDCHHELADNLPGTIRRNAPRHVSPKGSP